MSQPFDGYPIVVTATVLWSDMDLYGHVNNAVFFRWFELARMEYLSRSRFIESYDRDGIGAILYSTSCRFRRPVVHPDTVEIGTRVTEVGEDRFTMEYLARSTAQDAVVGEGSAIVVSFDYRTNVKTALPAPVRAAIREIDGR